MWACLSLLITVCLLHGGGAEGDGGGPRCQLPPAWKASRMDGLHQKLESQGLNDVVYMVVNQQGEQARHLHSLLALKLSENITLYKQDEQQPDIWQALGGEKDDFLVYDRCGRLTYHISLPYSIIGQGHIEGAIKDTYCKRVCGNCTHESTETPEECTRTPDAQPDADAAPAVEDGHGVDHGVHPCGHDHNHGQQGVSQQGQDQVGRRSFRFRPDTASSAHAPNATGCPRGPCEALSSRED